MKNVYVVSQIIGNKAIVFPFDEKVSDLDFNRQANAKIEALNDKNLPIEIGSKVKVSFSKGYEIFIGFGILLFPIILGGAALLFSQCLLRIFHLWNCQNTKFIIVLFFLFLGFFVDFKISKKLRPNSIFRIKSVV